MGTAEADWETVLDVRRQAPDKVIPCFGVHPWSAHLHAAATTSGRLGMLEAPHDGDAADVARLLPREPSATWQRRLRQLLEEHPGATVGECGLDRAAVLPGTKVQVSLSHQLSLLRQQLALAAELQRPVSLHCVRAYGALQGLLRELPPEAWPPRVMMHSYGGSPEFVATLLGLPNGLGRRLFFSFSCVIGAKGPPTKLMARIRAVPEDRLLLESDQTDAGLIDGGLDKILGIVAEASGRSHARVAHAAAVAFCDFYQGFLPAAALNVVDECALLAAHDNAARGVLGGSVE